MNLHQTESEVQPRFIPTGPLDGISTATKKAELFLDVGLPALALSELLRVSDCLGYLAANYPPDAILRGPVPQ